MNKLRLLELFGGIGACSSALTRLGIEYEIVDYVEIDKYAVKSYNAIHGTDFKPQDIKTWDKDIQVDLIMHGSPCQDFSIAGNQMGGDEGSGTRSSLMYETIRIVEKLKPKYVIWENVKNLLSKKHRHNFDAYLETMKQLGYTNYYRVLNAKDYGIPQNRERVFTISILGNEKYDFPKGNTCTNKIDVVGNYMPSGHDASRIVNENGLAPTVKENHGTVTAVAINFAFPQKQELTLRLKDVLEEDVDKKYYLSKTMLDYLSGVNQKTSNFPRGKRFVSNITRKNQDVANTILTTAGQRVTDNFIITPSIYTDNIIKGDIINTLTTNDSTLCIRKLTPKECWRLMGFTDEEFEKASQVNSNTQLYKQAGNSIVVNILVNILNNLLKGD